MTTAKLLRISKIVRILLPQFHSNVINFFSLETDKMLSRSFHCTQIFIRSIDSFLTVTDSYFLGSCKVPGTLQQRSQLSHSFQIKDGKFQGPEVSFLCRKVKISTYDLSAIFLLFSSQRSISSYLHYLKKVWLHYIKEKNSNNPERLLKVNLTEPTRLHTKGNHTGNGKRIFKLGGYFHIQIKEYSTLHNIFQKA